MRFKTYKIFTALLVTLLLPKLEATKDISVQFSAQGYWYAKALNGDPDIPEDLRFPFADFECLSREKCLRFFSRKTSRDGFEEVEALDLYS